MKIINIKEFKKSSNLLDGTELVLVIKSQDQLERRKRLIEGLKTNKLGRTISRPIAKGLVARVVLKNGKCITKLKKSFQEPRHIRSFKNSYIMTENNSVNIVDKNFNIIKKITNPYFAFLHTIELSLDENRALIVSSGFDACFEVDLNNYKIVWEWFAWENGFNPSKDGVWLCIKEEDYQNYLKEGKKCELINPEDYKGYGIITSKRTAHPNCAIYDPYENGWFYLSIGYKGEIYKINMSSLKKEKVFTVGNVMPHGIYKFNNGFMVTNTLKGEFFILSKDWEILEKYIIRDLPNKPIELQEVEWIQQVIPINDDIFLAIDANRSSLIIIDIKNKEYCMYSVDENWCVQDVLKESI